MDEVFWSTVVKRWSDASESVIKLKKELADLEEERALYIRAFGPLSQHQRNEHIDWSHFEDTHKGSVQQIADSDPTSIYASSSTIQDELQDAEIGLGKAKEEYRKLQHDLAVSAQTINALTLENQRLIHSHREEMDALREQYLHASIARNTPNPRSSIIPTADATPRQSPSYPSNLGEFNSASHIERQLAILTQTVEAKEADKQGLLHELESTRSRLHKAEDTIKALLASIVKLQEIARHSAYGSLQPISANCLHSESHRSSKVSFTSGHSHARNIENKHALKAKSTNSFDIAFPENPLVGDKTVVEPDASKSLPLEREKAILKFPSIHDAISVDESDNLFDRVFLKHILGEGVHELVDHFSENNLPFDKKNITYSYLCPTLDHHPWCPSIPGQHGFLFIGLGKDKEAYKSPVIKNLFVGLPKSQTKHRIFRYLGRYRVSRVRPLVFEEWHTLSKETKVMYANLTQDKGKDPRSLDEIISLYNKGELQVPCVQLQCISFDHPLYTALVSHMKAEVKL